MNPIVETRAGKIHGRRFDVGSGFLGIPFAAPPVGARRMRPPEPPAPWTGVRDATAFGPKSPQPAYPPAVARMLPELAGGGEDCLTLNVWAPEPGPAARPVMVWIPGGMFEYHGTGASPWYDGSRFARDGVVCVTVNYRVGADGFLFLGDGVANLGLLDQIAALEWVRDNVAAFGGDPGNVTIFGESAGAMSVATLLAVPRAEGLFRRAIAQSGAGHHALPAEAALRIGGLLAARLGVEPEREAIAALPVERVLAAQEQLRIELTTSPDPERFGPEVVTTSLPWQPVIDGDLLPGRPIDGVFAGAGAEIDLVVGTNLDETRLFLVPDGVIDGVPAGAPAAALAAYGAPVEPTLAAYRASRPGATPGELLSAIQTDWAWRLPALRLADAHAAGPAATFAYEVAWRSPAFGGRLGACHAVEIPFVFDTLGEGTGQLWGPDPPQGLADAMHAAWVAFAATGDCGWPRYDLERRPTMRFDDESAVVEDPMAEERALWEGVR